ncbi:hypothetical protein LCGC14_1582420 [marine sediment metagenome]|uniref:Uncharacterized protein n=1 Tax=marine sediment metagenome TaxID=412755 RepID=A0A0F9KX59_9ZZZZ
MSEHTKGPWEVTRYPNNKYLIAVDSFTPDADGISHQICGLEKGKAASGFLEIEQHLINAYLIAAAPDLLKACEMLAEAFPEENMDNMDASDFKDRMYAIFAAARKAKAAITKAGGK